MEIPLLAQIGNIRLYLLGATYLKDFHILSYYLTAASILSSTDLCRRTSERASGAALGSFLVVAKSSPLRIFAHKRSETHIYKQITDKKRDRKSVIQCWMYIVVKTHIPKYMLSVFEYSCFCNWHLKVFPTFVVKFHIQEDLESKLIKERKR